MKTLLILSAITAVTLAGCSASQQVSDEYPSGAYRNDNMLYSIYDPFYNPYNDPYAFGDTRYYNNGRYYTRPVYTRPAYSRPVYVQPSAPQNDRRYRRPERNQEYRNTAPVSPQGGFFRRAASKRTE